MEEIIIKSQQEYDNLPKNFESHTIVKIDAINIKIENKIEKCEYWLINNATATLWNNATARLWNNATATLCNSSYAFVYNNNTVTAYENAVVSGRCLQNTTIHDNATKKEIIDLAISFDTWLERGFVICDGIYQKYISEEKLGDITLYKTDGGFVAKKDNVFSHGKTKYTAFSDLRFKLSNRNTAEFKSWNKEQKRSIEELIYCYRCITGACAFGCEDFCKRLDTEKQYSINDVIELIDGQYGHNKFKEFFNER